MSLQVHELRSDRREHERKRARGPAAFVLVVAWMAVGAGCSRSTLLDPAGPQCPEGYVRVGAVCRPDGMNLDDASVSDSGPIQEDGSTGRFDGGADASLVDGGFVDASAPTTDAGPSEVDAGVACGDCAAVSPCQTARCTAMGCEVRNVRDGLACGASPAFLCVSGSCVEERCGDGYPKPGVEACDDGNGIDDDGCRSDCTSVAALPDVDPADRFSTRGTSSGHAIGVDGLGNVLVAYLRVSDTDERLMIRRLGAYGAPLDAAPTELDVLTVVPSFAEPTVVGLRDGGWVVAWTAYRGGSQDVVFRVVGANGVPGYETIGNRQRSGDQRGAVLTALDDGFLLGWTDLHGISGDSGSGVVVRGFGPDSVGRTNDVRIADGRDEDQGQLRLASSETDWIAVWQTSGFSTGYLPRLLARRFSGTSAVDSVDIPLAMNADVADVAADSLGHFSIVWRDFGTDSYGDVASTRLDANGAWDGIVLPVSALASYRESMPRIATTPDDAFLVAWEDGPLGRIAVRFPYASSFGASTAALLELLQQQAVGGLSLASSPYGVWFAFDADRASQFTDSLTLFLEPLP